MLAELFFFGPGRKGGLRRIYGMGGWRPPEAGGNAGVVFRAARAGRGAWAIVETPAQGGIG